jgi:hypothetical protein
MLYSIRYPARYYHNFKIIDLPLIQARKQNGHKSVLFQQLYQVQYIQSKSERGCAKNSLEDHYRFVELPAQLIRPHGVQPIWLVDKAGSRKLTAQTDEEQL